MKLAMIGLGKMGANMTKRLMLGGHECVVYDQSTEKRNALKSEGAAAIDSLEQVKSLPSPRIVWVMLPSGEPTEETIGKLAELLSPGDIIIDGGNTHYKDDVRRAKELKARKISYVDVGVSGGVWGLEKGYCLMYGGDKSAAVHLDPILKTLAPGEKTVSISSDRNTDPSSSGASAKDLRSTADAGYLYCGPAGSGHFVKMVHNGIEYGMMQAFAEGFELLHHFPALSEEKHSLDLKEISEVWRRGSVVASWLLDLIALSLNRDTELSKFSGFVEDSGEGRWTLEAAIDSGVPVPVIANSLFVRFRSRQNNSFAERLLSAMRNEFGGHVEPIAHGGQREGQPKGQTKAQPKSQKDVA
jgi:6-phosphogluconate dehydrogenase